MSEAESAQLSPGTVSSPFASVPVQGGREGGSSQQDSHSAESWSRPVSSGAMHFTGLRPSAQQAASVFAHLADLQTPVQRRSAGLGIDDPRSVHDAAIRGIAGSGDRIPYADRIQQSFGRHDISQIQAHIGGAATAATARMQAEAYATGNHVAFGSHPDLHTAAHEAAHVVQQRGGVHLKGGIGQRGDSYEENADAVADRVVQGKSAEDLLDSVCTQDKGVGPGTTALAVQKKGQDGKKGVSSKAMTRIAKAKKAIAHTKRVLKYGAGNQFEALKASRFNTYYRLVVMRDENHIYWQIDDSVRELVDANPEAFTAAKADIAHGGNCGEHADIAFNYLRVTAKGEILNNSSVEGLDHGFVIMGDIGSGGDSNADLVVADPWPTTATATLWEDHFAFTEDRSKIDVSNRIVADGLNIKKVIAAGLTLTEAGKMALKEKDSRETTRRQLEEGTQGDHPWIWQQPNAAAEGKDHSYVKQETAD